MAKAPSHIEVRGPANASSGRYWCFFISGCLYKSSFISFSRGKSACRESDNTLDFHSLRPPFSSSRPFFRIPSRLAFYFTGWSMIFFVSGHKKFGKISPGRLSDEEERLASPVPALGFCCRFSDDFLNCLESRSRKCDG